MSMIKVVTLDRLNDLVQITTNFAKFSLKDHELLVVSFFQHVLREYPEEERKSVAIRIASRALDLSRQVDDFKREERGE